MNWYDVLDIALQLVEGVLEKVQGSGQTVEQLENAQAALEMLRQFRGSPVTKAQLEQLRG